MFRLILIPCYFEQCWDEQVCSYIFAIIHAYCFRIIFWKRVISVKGMNILRDVCPIALQDCCANLHSHQQHLRVWEVFLESYGDPVL